MKFCETDLVFCTKLDYFSNCCHSAPVAILQLKFSSWPKILFESTWLSTISAVLLWLVYSKSATILPSAWAPAGDTSLRFHVCGTSCSMCCTCHIWWRTIALCTNKTCTHTSAKMQTHTGTRVFLSSSCLERMPPKPIPRGVSVWRKSIHGQHCLNSKYLLGRMSQSMWKTNSINSDFIVFHFFFSPRKNNRHVPWQNSVWLLAFLKLFVFFYK